jgi:hypothetical protein
VTRVAIAPGIVATLRREPSHRDEVVANADRDAETRQDLQHLGRPDEHDPIRHHELDGDRRIVVERIADLDEQTTARELLSDVIA